MTIPIVLIVPRGILPRRLRADRSGVVYIDLTNKTIWRHGCEVLRSQKSHSPMFLAAAVLISSYPRVVEDEVLFDYIWGDDPEGGPDDPRFCLYIATYRAKSRLVTLGFNLCRHHSRGFYLETIEQQQVAA